MEEPSGAAAPSLPTHAEVARRLSLGDFMAIVIGMMIEHGNRAHASETDLILRLGIAKRVRLRGVLFPL